jgi:hypothetical protein
MILVKLAVGFSLFSTSFYYRVNNFVNNIKTKAIIKYVVPSSVRLLPPVPLRDRQAEK